MKIEWNGRILLNGKEVPNGYDLSSIAAEVASGRVVIELLPAEQPAPVIKPAAEVAPVVPEEPEEKEYRITVKKYMTETSSPGFDFMAKWNGDIPMPLRIMTGTVVKETRGMVYMELHGEMYAQKMCTCMKCGRTLTNPVSQYFGIGPECGGHNYTNPFEDEDQLREAVAEYRKKLQAIQWEGWVIKSAITNWEEV